MGVWIVQHRVEIALVVSAYIFGLSDRPRIERRWTRLRDDLRRIWA